MWSACVSVAYAQEVEFINSYSRFSTRCLKLRVEQNDNKEDNKEDNKDNGQKWIWCEGSKKRRRAKTDKCSESKRRNQGLPGENFSREEIEREREWESGCYFSDTEDEIAGMPEKHQKIYRDLKKKMHGYHPMEDSWYITDVKDLINDCFQVAVDKILPGHGEDYALKIEFNGGRNGRADEGAKTEMAYLEYVPSACDAPGIMEMGEIFVGMPWGNMLSPVKAIDDKQRKVIDEHFALIVDTLGLKPINEPGYKLATFSSGC